MDSDHFLKKCNGPTLGYIWFWLVEVNLKSSDGLSLIMLKNQSLEISIFWETWGLVQYVW